MARVKVDVSEIKTLRRDLNKIDKNLTKELRQEFIAIGKVIADDARGAVPSKSGRAARSIRAGMAGNVPYVAGGRKSVPYYGWLDFGSRTPKTGQPRRIGPWAKTGKGPKRGRFIYQAIYRNRKRIDKAARDAMDAAKKKSLGG